MPNKKLALEALETYQQENNFNIPKKEIAGAHYFKSTGTFTAVNTATKFLEKIGYSVGCMQCDAPIAVAKGNDMYISKWYNLGEDKNKIDGVIIPDPEFREGGTAVILFKEDVGC